jgi:hypothetical protein
VARVLAVGGKMQTLRHSDVMSRSPAQGYGARVIADRDLAAARVSEFWLHAYVISLEWANYDVASWSSVCPRSNLC